MKEVNFNSIMVRSLRNISLHAHKIPDMPFRGNGTRFIPQKPYDIFAVGHDGFLAIEGKLVKPKTKSTYSKFSFNKIEKHQFDNLIDANERKMGVGVLALYIWRSNKIKEVNIVPIDFILDAEESGECGFSPEFLEHYPYKYNCHKDLFALPINFDKFFLDLKNAGLPPNGNK